MNVALEASAGTGKTKVLVDRYVNLLRAGVDPAHVLAMTRFNDPEANDALIVITDEVRSDGGVGRAWRLNGSQSPVEIPLNGHDVWGECRLIQCYNAVVLLRHGAARHYFAASAIDAGTDTITLNTDEVEAMLPRIRQKVSIPVGVGFGIRDAQTAQTIAKVADAVVIGSKIIQLIENESRDKVATVAGDFLRWKFEPIHLSSW